MDMITPSGNNGNIYELKEIKNVNIEVNGKLVVAMNAVLDILFRELKDTKKIDSTNMDIIFLNTVRELEDVGLVKKSMSLIFPFCNYYTLESEELLDYMIRCFERVN